MKIEGIPDGWELVRIGKLLPSDWFINHLGEPKQNMSDCATNGVNYPVIRRIPPPLNIPPIGVRVVPCGSE